MLLLNLINVSLIASKRNIDMFDMLFLIFNDIMIHYNMRHFLACFLMNRIENMNRV
jgi:hypothetical protein